MNRLIDFSSMNNNLYNSTVYNYILKLLLLLLSSVSLDLDDDTRDRIFFILSRRFWAYIEASSKFNEYNFIFCHEFNISHCVSMQVTAGEAAITTTIEFLGSIDPYRFTCRRILTPTKLTINANRIIVTLNMTEKPV